MTQTFDAPEAPAPRWSDLFAGDLLPFSVVLGGGVVLHAMNVFVSATIMPSVVADIGGIAFYAWATTLFVMASIVGAALTSRLMQLFGPRKTYLIAFGLFCLGTFICGQATSIGLFNAGRSVQGGGGGMLYALAYAVIRSVFPERLWPLAIGLITLMWGVATMAGPAVGGVFAELQAWRFAFFSLLPVAALLSFLCLRVFPGDHQRESADVSVPWTQLGLLLAIVAVVSIGSADAVASTSALSILAAAALMLLLLRIEKSAHARLLPLSVFQGNGKLGLLYLYLALMMIGMQPEAFVPYFLQVLQGQPPLIAGYMGALMALGWTCASALSAKFTGRRADRTLILGALFSFVGLGLQVVLLPVSLETVTGFAALALGLVLVGFGIGFCWPHLTTRIFSAAEAADQDAAATAVTTVQLFATALGASLAGMAANAGGMTEPGGMAGASSAAFWLFLTFLIAPALAFPMAIRATASEPRN